MNKCSHIKPNGEKCQASSLQEDKFCLWHSESEKAVKKRLEGSVEGGKNSLYKLDVQDWKYEDSKSVIRLLELCINKTVQGQMPTRISNSVAYLTNALIAAVKNVDFEERLEAVEHALEFQD